MKTLKSVLKGLMILTIAITTLGAIELSPVQADTKTITESNDDYYVEQGDIITEYNNHAYSVYNHNTNKFEVYFDELGDWGYSVDTQQEVNRIVDSYNFVKTYTEDTKDFYVTNTYVKDGNVFTEYNDLSWSRYNLDKNEFEVYFAIIEDDSILLNDMQELNNIIATYKSIKETGMY
ncbi:hypothetical protein [Clostridium botulinum]|uniref:hypothetical protein n=1 Tax=Clostridium botulinum TaxID=1491 RepID=UPI001C9A7A65|nr:hypothetical protein [Clostridium botulinum]MBY6838791.1 hypothetical protein [Clostridium botulinum]